MKTKTNEHENDNGKNKKNLSVSKDLRDAEHPLVPLPISSIERPDKLLKEPGDRMELKIGKNNAKITTIHAGGVKRSRVAYTNGTVVEHTSYR